MFTKRAISDIPGPFLVGNLLHWPQWIFFFPILQQKGDERDKFWDVPLSSYQQLIQSEQCNLFKIPDCIDFSIKMPRQSDSYVFAACTTSIAKGQKQHKIE